MSGSAPTTAAIGSQWALLAEWLRRLPDGSVAPFPLPGIDPAADGSGGGFEPLPPVTTVEPGPVPADLEPALKHLDDDVLNALRACLRDDPTDHRIWPWAEKLLRVTELRRRELKERSRRDGESMAQGRRRMLVLSLFFLECFAASADPRFVNVALKVMDRRWMDADLPRRRWLPPDPGEPVDPADDRWTDAAVVLVHALLDRALDRIAAPDFRTEIATSADHCILPAPELGRMTRFEGDDRPRVVIFCPNPSSLYTLTVAHQLSEQGVRIEGIAVRRLLNRGRLVQELRRDGMRLVGKVWNKAFLRRRAYARRRYSTMPEFMADLGVAHRTVIDWASENDVPVWRCDTLNDDNIADALHRTSPDAVVFTGGGLIRPEVLKASGAGIINTHMGLLPRYRGMDVVEWPILEGHLDHVGLTVHFMAEGLDEGDVLVMHTAPQQLTEDIGQLRERMEVLGAAAAVSGTVGYLAGEIRPEAQVIADGRQYFVMHERLNEIADRRYRRARSDRSSGA